MRAPAEKAKQFKREGKVMLGYAIGFKTLMGDEVVMFCPTKKAAVEAGKSFGGLDSVDRKEIRRAALGPVESRAATQIAEGE